MQALHNDGAAADAADGNPSQLDAGNGAAQLLDEVVRQHVAANGVCLAAADEAVVLR